MRRTTWLPRRRIRSSMRCATSNMYTNSLSNILHESQEYKTWYVGRNVYNTHHSAHLKVTQEEERSIPLRRCDHARAGLAYLDVSMVPGQGVVSVMHVVRSLQLFNCSSDPQTSLIPFIACYSAHTRPAKLKTTSKSQPSTSPIVPPRALPTASTIHRILKTEANSEGIPSQPSNPTFK